MPRHVIPMITTMIFLASHLIALTILKLLDSMGPAIGYLRVNPCGGKFSIQVASGLDFGHKFLSKIPMTVPQAVPLAMTKKVY